MVVVVIGTQGACLAIPSAVLDDTVGATFEVEGEDEGDYLIKGTNFIRGLKDGRRKTALEYHDGKYSQFSRLRIGKDRCRVLP
jgi:hypothetical protein